MSNDNTTRDLLYERIEDVERLENYRPGGFHPVTLGDVFHSRYRVVDKLGHGSYSTTWLAHDDQTNQYVAVKVCTGDSNPKEIDILSILADSQCSQLGRMAREMIPSILDSFTLRGPNGAHECYVTTPASTSLSGAKNGSWIRLFQLEVARAIAAQVAIALEYTHCLGVVNGDLHLGNILLKLPTSFGQLSVEGLHKAYGEPELEPVVGFDGGPLPPNVPTYGIPPIWLGEASEKIPLLQARILLTDFGEAFLPRHEARHESHAPLVMRPPEVRFEPTIPLSFPSDIWSLACSIWSIVAQRDLFEGFFATHDDMTCEHVDALGMLPPDWWDQWEVRHLKFTEDGKPINRKIYRSWDDRFEDSVQQPREASGMPRIVPEERDALFTLLRSMLSFRPGERPTARQVLESE